MATFDCNTINALNELAIRYARYVDRCEFEKFTEIFCADARIIVFPGDPATHQSLYQMDSLAQIQQAFQLLHRYQRTFHFVGQQLVLDVAADSASSETYCIASHFHTKQDKEHCYVMYIRYQNRFTKVDEQWKIQQRQVIIDRTDGEDVDV